MKKILFWLRKHYIHPIIRHNPYETSLVIQEEIIIQMLNAKIGYSHINKWLEFQKCPTIKAYGRDIASNNIRIFWTNPTQEQRKTVKETVFVL